MVKPRIALVGLLAVASCTFPEVPLPAGRRAVVVHAVLDPSSRVQTIALSTTQGNGDTTRFLDSASVVVIAPDGQELQAVQDSPVTYKQRYYGPVPLGSVNYRIKLDSYGLNIEPGSTYRLRVATRAGDTVTGTTTVPLVAPAPLQVLSAALVRDLDTLRIGWSAVPGARSYEVQIWATGAYYGPNTVLRRSVFTGPGVFSLAGTARSLGGDEDIFLSKSTTTAVVMAVDANYYEYYRDLGDPFVGSSPGRLIGGFGVFGSVVPFIQRQFKVF